MHSARDYLSRAWFSFMNRCKDGWWKYRLAQPYLGCKKPRQRHTPIFPCALVVTELKTSTIFNVTLSAMRGNRYAGAQWTSSYEWLNSKQPIIYTDMV